MKTVKNVRRGAAAIIFRKGRRSSEFLVTHRVIHWRGWEALKGEAVIQASSRVKRWRAS